MDRASPFSGFPPETVTFLGELAAHNEREWFLANKGRYETQVLEPALSFIAAMASGLAALSPRFEAIPKRTGGSLMRVYRDTRFSNDKRPYKTNIGIQFRHERGRDVHAPGFYVHIAPDECFLGAGVWHPDAAALVKIRAAIDADPDGWRQARDHPPFASRFTLEGDCLKRVPKGFAAEHPLAEDLKRKDYIAVADLGHADILKPDLPWQVTDAFGTTAPLMRFLCHALELEF